MMFSVEDQTAEVYNKSLVKIEKALHLCVYVQEKNIVQWSHTWLKCSAIPTLKFLTLFKQSAGAPPHFHFSLGLAIYIAVWNPPLYPQFLGQN